VNLDTVHCTAKYYSYNDVQFVDRQILKEKKLKLDCLMLTVAKVD